MTKEEKRKYDREYYAKRSPEAKARKLKKQKDRTRGIILWVREYKKTQRCKDCGEADPIVLEFDHLETSEKKFNIGDCCRLGWSKETLKKEMSKCEVVCANCHRRRTAKQHNWYIRF